MCHVLYVEFKQTEPDALFSGRQKASLFPSTPEEQIIMEEMTSFQCAKCRHFSMLGIETKHCETGALNFQRFASISLTETP